MIAHIASKGTVRMSFRALPLFFVIAMTGISITVRADEGLDVRVQQYLDAHARDWRDMNVPYQDGKILHDIIVERGFTRAFEIGTSTGHSTIWIAWALSKTGGLLDTVEIDERRYEEARENVAAAGLEDYVEFILGDAHDIVPALEGSYDFVFSDADKGWYINYFDEMYPKLTENACFVAHNVSVSSSATGKGWADEYFAHVRKVPDMLTIVRSDSRRGIATTCKEAKRSQGAVDNR